MSVSKRSSLIISQCEMKNPPKRDAVEKGGPLFNAFDKTYNLKQW
jgi:hypothetical protein